MVLLTERPGAERGLVRRAGWYAALVFVALRAGLSLLGLTVGHFTQNAPPVVPIPSPAASAGLHNLWDGLNRFDARWFTFIAQHGYDPGRAAGSAAFFPLYPLLIRALDAIPGIGALGAAVIVSNVSFYGALVALYVLTTHEIGEADARRTVVVLATFPTAFFFLAPFSESLFLVLTLLAFASVRAERWIRGGALGAAAAATRQIGIVLVPAFMVEAWLRRDRTEPGRRWLPWVGSLAVALGPALYLAWWGVHAHDLTAPMQAEHLWNRQLAFPLTTLGRGFAQALLGLHRPDGGYWISEFGLTAVVIAGTVTVLRKVAPSYLVYAACSILVPLTYPSLLGRDLFSMSRFVIVIFPAFWGIAYWCRHRIVYVTWLLVSIPLLAWHAILFMHWRYIY
jgi:hypothetical protein